MPRFICDAVSSRNRELTAESIVPYVVDHAPDYHDGELERLRRELDALTKIVGWIAAKLPPEMLVELANNFHYEKFHLEQDV